MRQGPPSRLEVITGPMFSGKSEELMRRVRRARIAGRSAQLVGHALDTRSGTGLVSSHAGQQLEARPVADIAELLAVAQEGRPDLLAIDEAQFFGPDLVDAATAIVAAGTTVIAEGLCVTFDGRPFEPLPGLMALAEDVVKLTAVCSQCGEDAVYHQRITAAIVDSGDSLRATAGHIGGAETYQAKCRRHFQPAR